MQKNEYFTGEDLGYKLNVFEKGKFEYSPLGITLNKAIKPADNAMKPVKSNSSLIYGSYSFVEFKRDAEKFKKIPSLDSKDKVTKRILEKLNKFKKSPLRMSDNKKEKKIVKKNVQKIYHKGYYDVYKKNIIRRKIN